MKEYMLLIRNEIDHQANWPEEKHREFLKGCEAYIARLREGGRLKAAQPLVREGVLISGAPGRWIEAPFNQSKEVQVGYYHILAADLQEAVALAKENPEFAFSSTARIEVRPVKAKEATTGFAYPAGGHQER